jgi:hypothetical protein
VFEKFDTAEGVAARQVLTAAMQGAPMAGSTAGSSSSSSSSSSANKPQPGYEYTDLKELGVHGRAFNDTVRKR